MTHVVKVDEKRLAKVKALHKNGLSIRDIAQRIGVSKTAVSCDLYRIRALPDNSKTRLGDKLPLAIEGWNDGMLMKDLAKMCGKSETSMKHIIFIMKCYGHIEERKTPTWNKGKRLPISARHKAMFDKMVAIKGWEKMGRTELAAQLHIPVTDFITYWRVFCNRGMVTPKGQGRIKGSASSVQAVARGLAGGAKPKKDLWALALGRRSA